MTSRAPQERPGSFFFFRRGGRFPFSGGKSFHAHLARTHVSCRTFHGVRLPRIIGLLITGIVLEPYALDLRYLADAGLPSLLLLVIGLIFRSVGTHLSLLGTALDLRERLFPVIAYLPKATVQAAIGGAPLAMSLPCGGLILSVAVLSILVTAPLGAIGMEVACPRWITREA